jgi:hypothetical protein
VYNLRQPESSGFGCGLRAFRRQKTPKEVSMSMEPEVPPPQEDMKTTLMWTGGAIALVALFAVWAAI